MSTDVDASGNKVRRPLTFFLLGLLLFAATIFLLYDRLTVHAPLTQPPKAYTYNVTQSMQQVVHYRQSSFFNTVPDVADTAYLADITSDIDEALHYQFVGDRLTDLHYTYGAQATVQSTTGSRTGGDGIANVWTKQYTLLKQTAYTRRTKLLILDPKVQLPFTEYKQAIDQFKNAFSAPLNSSVTLTIQIQVAGKVDGASFVDDKISTVTIPLDQQIYRPEVKFINYDAHAVLPKQSFRLAGIINHYELPFALIIAGLGVGCTIYGLRRQRIKTPHQRELEKIFRYHEGIIVRASHPIDLADKNVVPVQSFDDLLTIEEETKEPIIASRVSSKSTHFIITSDDIAYVFTQGQLAPLKSAAKREVHTATAATQAPTHANRRRVKIT
ncbi:MAG TPA: DUF5305 family protein [Candidatus Saccharimonadales bacterium]|nr:DUF5305 family protein [Candidatus Saccharimonadales bacterium]